MAILEIAQLFVSAISALSSAVEAVKTVKEITEDDITRVEQKAIQSIGPSNNSVQSLAAANIDPEYIEIATENIQKASKRLKDALRDPSITQAHKTTEEEAAQFTICSELKRLKRLNQGQLPGSDRFYSLWDQHACNRV